MIDMFVFIVTFSAMSGSKNDNGQEDNDISDTNAPHLYHACI